jgi:hypothetical protein
MPLRILHELRWRIEAERLRIEHRGADIGGMVALQPTAGVDDQRERGRMGFGEAVLAEALDLLKNLANDAS